MKTVTITQIVKDIHAGKDLDPKVAGDTILALHSMLTRSRMTIETIASHLDNQSDLHFATKCYLGNLDCVRQERKAWMDSDPKIWLLLNNAST